VPLSAATAPGRVFACDVVGGKAFTGTKLEDLEPSPEVVYETREIHQVLRGAVQALPPEQRETVALHYVQGLRISEIAILSGVPTGTVKARLHRARTALRKALLAEIEGAGYESFDGGLNMIELCVHDVVVQAPKDDPGKWLTSGKDYKLGFFRVILLKEVSGDRIHRSGSVQMRATLSRCDWSTSNGRDPPPLT
jgi:hypothetical protein